MLLRFFGLIIMLLYLVACGGPVTVRQHNASGQLTVSGQTQRGMQSGTWTYYHSNGALRSIGNWQLDKQTGPWQFWYANGQLKQEGSYLDGQRVGNWSFYFANGQIQAHGYYERERQQGLWTYFHQGGTLAAQGLFAQGERIGVWSWFDQYGKLIEQGSYLAGRKIGPWLQDGSWQHQGALADGHLSQASQGMWIQHQQPDQVYTWQRAASGISEIATLVRAHTMYVQWWHQGQLQVSGRLLGGEWMDTPAHFGCRVGFDRTSLRIDDAGVEVDLGSRAETKQELQAWCEQARQAALAVQKRPPTRLQRPSKTPLAPIALDALHQTLTVNPLADLPTDSVNWTAMDHSKAQKSAQVYADQGSFDTGSFSYTSSSEQPQGTIRRDLIGKNLPQLRFIKQDGTILNVADNFGKRKTAFIVLRGFGGQVCPYCAGQTRAVMTRLKEFQAANTDVIFCYPGPATAIPRFLQAVKLLGDDLPPVTLALDIELQLVRALAIEKDLSKPTSIILDESGTIRYAYVGIDLSDRPTVDELLAAIRKAQAR